MKIILNSWAWTCLMGFIPLCSAETEAFRSPSNPRAPPSQRMAHPSGTVAKTKIQKPT